MDELRLLDHVEQVAVAWRPEGEWLTKLDIQKKGDALVLVEMDKVGGRGCRRGGGGVGARPRWFLAGSVLVAAAPTHAHAPLLRHAVTDRSGSATRRARRWRLPPTTSWACTTPTPRRPSTRWVGWRGPRLQPPGMATLPASAAARACTPARRGTPPPPAQGGLTRQSFTDLLCKRWSQACAAAAPRPPKAWAPAGPWAPKSGGQDLDRMMGEMEEQGLRGRLYSREELTEEMGDLSEGMEDVPDEQEL